MFNIQVRGSQRKVSPYGYKSSDTFEPKSERDASRVVMDSWDYVMIFPFHQEVVASHLLEVEVVTGGPTL